MIIYTNNKLHIGLKVLFKHEPYIIESSNFVKPGKGQAFVRVKMRRLLTGHRIEKVFKTTDSMQSADVLEINIKYLYFDNMFYYFMDTKTFEQYSISKKLIGNVKKWLLSNVEYSVTLWNKIPIQIIAPNFIKLKVIATQLVLKKETISSNETKLATLSTGVVVKVPLFIKVGQKVKIDTRSGLYVARIKI